MNVKKHNNRIKIILFIMTIFLILLIPKNVQAVGLQANKDGESLVNTKTGVFFSSIRQMEDEHGTLGTTNDTADSKNGIDCHMAKNTEWGTAAMLSASRYGSIQNSNDGTTTGNKSGIYQMASQYGEFVSTYWLKGAWGTGEENYRELSNAENKYKNFYGTGQLPTDAKISGSAWFSWYGENGVTTGNSGTWSLLYRGNSGNIFYAGTLNNQNESNSVTSRAAVVCAPGI